MATADGVPLCYEFEGDGLGLAAGFDVTFHYEEAVLASLGIAEADLRLWHYGPTGLNDVTGSLDTAGNLITGNASALGGFAVGVIPEPSTLALLCMGAVGLLVCGWRRRCD